jgi:hypothetical protein
MVDTGGHADFGPYLHEQVFERWVEPELVSRDGLDGSTVRRAVVLMTDSPTVLINDVIANVVAARPIVAGEEVTEADYTEVKWAHPLNIAPNVRWMSTWIDGQTPWTTAGPRARGCVTTCA